MKTMAINVEPWFVGKDVAIMLEYAQTAKAIREHVEEEDKTNALIQCPGSNYKSKTMLTNESGLYALILSSKPPQAKEFKRWVTSEVLPQIKKVGGYIPINGCNLVLWFYSSIFFTHTPIRIIRLANKTNRLLQEEINATLMCHLC